MKNFFSPILILFFIIFSIEKVKAQVSITNPANTTPPLSATYTSLANAVTALQSITSITGPVTITLNPGNPQTAPAGGYTIRFAANAIATTPITIAGNNNIITAFTPQSTGTVTDAIFKIVGADYITIRDFTMQENSANTGIASVTNTMTEWGVAFLNKSASDGAQHNSIQNNTISLNRAYSNSFGIYSNTNHSDVEVNTDQPITNATTAPNNENKIYGNVISNVNMGISFIGSAIADYMDTGNDIGGLVAGTGNTITNWGGMIAESGFISNPLSTSYCILVNHQKDENVSYNMITSATISGTSIMLRGILKDYSVTVPTGTFTSNITNNTVTIHDDFATATTIECISSMGIITTLSTATININGNNILNTTMGNVTTPSGSLMTGIINSSLCGILNMNSNIFRGNTMATPNAAFTGISNTAAVTNVININNNKLGDAVGNCLTMPAGSWNQVTGLWCKDAGFSAALSISGNNFQGFVNLGASSNPYIFIYFEHRIISPVTDNFNDNTFTNLYLNTSEYAIFFLRNGGNMEPFAGATMNYNNNKIIGVYSKPYPGMYSGQTIFIDNFGYSAPGNNTNIIGNDFSNVISLGESGTIYGISSIDGGGVATIANNIFQNWNCGGQVILIDGSGADTTYITNNLVTNITSASAITAINTEGDSLIVCNNNTILDLVTTVAGGAEMLGITSLTSNVTTQYITDNTIGNFSSSKGAMTAGIRISNGSLSTTNVAKNKIYHLSGSHISASAVVVGIDLPAPGAGTTNIYDNIIADLRSFNANNANGIMGINIASVAATASHNIYYNTIYLDAPASTGTNFGTSGIYVVADAIPTNGMLTLRNNIIVNTSAVHGGGITAVIRRSASTLANYSTASNNNIFYAGMPSATNVMLRYATTGFQTLAAYKTKVSPADTNSFTELPPFLNTTVGTDANYLHIDGTSATQAESGAVNIAGITDDIDPEVRQGNPGYMGTGTAPDIGADEFDGFFVVPVSITSISASRNPDKTITVKWKGESEINLDKYIVERSSNGQNFKGIESKDPVGNNGSTVTYQYNDIYPNQENNYYRIRSVNLDGRVQYSAIVSVDPLQEPGSIIIYPNPITDKILNIHFVNQPIGTYKLQLTNKSGQLIYTSNIYVEGINITKSITLGQDVAAGNYQMNIIKVNGKKVVQQIMIR